ncbi:hypothetical protein ALI44B_01650 [Leifsonia sp. ALI-44-B]|jgi:hypothetical protein|uniref:putative acetyltransferase n=1 Tax=Leifsonia sp. ALI-44-B TaxID=1933776 RepID=UPI00097C3E49|nr:hypothetical protein [Leifsonia sp. ALI-44-B]ONI63447.1 hypothetical protein ALI44B_01650 [Leifsonia sp. ALI-44-B]
MPSLDPTAELRALPLGTRVVVRWALRDGMPEADGIHRYTDALGLLIARDESGIGVETTRGLVHIGWGDVLAGKRVPDPPVRRTSNRSIS